MFVFKAMKVLWICGLPNEVRLVGAGFEISPIQTPAWSWILGHLPPPSDVELHILCPVLGLKDPRVEFKWNGVQWHCFRQKRFEQAFLWFRFYLSIKKFVRDLRPDAVHGWGGETGCGWLATLLTRRAVVSVQGLLALFDSQLDRSGKIHKASFASSVLRFLERHSYWRARILLTESEVSKRELDRFYGKDSRVVPHPLRPQFLKGVNGVHHRGARLLFVGQMSLRKGVLDLVHALLRCSGVNFGLTMIGSGALADEVRKLVLASCTTNRVEILTHCTAEEVRQHMAAADFLFCRHTQTRGRQFSKRRSRRGSIQYVIITRGRRNSLRGMAADWSRLVTLMDWRSKRIRRSPVSCVCQGGIGGILVRDSF